MTGRRYPSPRAGLAAVLIALALPFSVAASSRLDFDVRGLKLGMTPTAVHAAIRAEGLPAVQRPLTTPMDEHDFYIDEIRINKRPDLEFVSSIVSRPRLNDGTRRVRELVVAAFTPPPGDTQAWGIGYEREYLPKDMPQAQAVLERLLGKYGKPSWTQGFDRWVKGPGRGAMLWYWDKSDR